MSGESARTRRGAAIAVVVVMLAMLQIAALSMLTGGADDAEEVVLRVQTLRAFYAGESGAAMALGDALRGLPPPSAGTVIELPGASVELLETPWDGAGASLVVEGRSVSARRRFEIRLE
jgi:hypothetical protein